MRIKFGQLLGNSLTLCHFEKKARRTTDLGETVNHNSRPVQREQQAFSARVHAALNRGLFVIIKLV